jgi:signal recognition particle subunit SEC65
VFNTKSVISTSSDIDIALDFVNPNNSCCLYKISVSPGSRVLPLYGISDAPEEEEILLEMNGLYDITYRTKENIPYSMLSKGNKFSHVIYITYRPPQSLMIENSAEIELIIENDHNIPMDKLISLYADNITDVAEDLMYDIHEENDFKSCLDIVYKQLKIFHTDLKYPSSQLISKIKQKLSKFNDRYNKT